MSQLVVGYDPALPGRPIVCEHDGVMVVRDDLFPGGTKARVLPPLFRGVEEVVYASPAEGGAQTALATVARALGKRATIFVAARDQQHARTIEAGRLGARIERVRPGYLSVVRKRAADYVRQRGGAARLAPFGMDLPEAIHAIEKAAASIGIVPNEVWCASGSGVLARGLAMAWPKARRHVVQVGRRLTADDVLGARVHVHPKPFGGIARLRPPFPSDPHYDAKAWEIMQERRGRGLVLFWNVAGPALAQP